MLELIHFNGLFDLPLFAKLWVKIILALTGDKPCHVLLHEWLLDDLNDSWSRFFIFDQKHINQVFHSLTISVGYWLLFILHNLENESKQIFCVKGVFKGAELIQDATQSPDIRLVGVRFILAHFWRHVVWCTLHRHCMVLRALKHLRNTEIAQLNRIALGQENVLRFNIPMQNLTTVDVIKGKAQLHEPVHDFSFRKLFVFRFLFPHVKRQVAMLAVLHNNYQNTFFDERVLVGHDVWVIEFP